MAFEGGQDDGAAGLLGGAGSGGGNDDGKAAGADAGGDAGAEAGGAGKDGGAGGGADAAPDWYDKLNGTPGEGETASNRDWAQAARIKDLDGLVKVARDNQRALRESGRVKVPGEGAKPEEIAAWHKAIGVPEDAKGYEVKGPEGVELNAPLIDRLAGAAHQAGIPKAAFEATVSEFIQAQLDEAAEETKRQDGLAQDKLKEWGAKKDENLAHVTAGMRALGLSGKDGAALRSALGADRALELMAKIGSGVAEDTLVTGGKGSFGVSGPEAKAQLDAMKADPEIAKKILVPGSPERIRYDRLNKAVAEFSTRKEAA